MSRYEHDNWGDIQDYIFAKGIITAVDSENDTADVTVEGYLDGSDIPIFYHCSNDAEERDNGAIEGGSAAFSVSDEVMVMCEADTGIPVRIIGFVDGIKVCGWEPWGEALCDNHTWSILPAGQCLELPLEYYDGPSSVRKTTASITDGVLTFGTELSALHYFTGTNAYLQWMDSYDPTDTPPKVGNVRFKVDDINFYGSNQVQTCYLWIRTSLHQIYILLWYTGSYVFPDLLDISSFFVAGEEYSYNLTDYGFTTDEDITQVTFMVGCNRLGYAVMGCSMSIDYIHF